MTSHELLEELKTLTAPATNDRPGSYFLNVAFTLADTTGKEIKPFEEERHRFITFKRFLANILGRRLPPRDVMKQSWDEILSDIERFLSQLDLKRFFLSVADWESALARCRLNLDETDAADIFDDSRKFVDTIQQYFAAGADRKSVLYDAAECAENLVRHLRILKAFEMFVIDNLSESVSDSNDGQAVLALLMDCEWDLEQLVKKLDALNSVYLELCQLFNVSSKEFPLRIGRVETGSLWIRLFGESRVVTAMVTLLESSVSFLHRNFTREGQILSFPRSLEAISSLLDLERKLADANIETKHMREHIQKSSIVVARDLARLLSGEPKVEVNGKEYSVGTELEKVYIAQSKRMLLESTLDDESN
jgi:hypothetical protein